jgi:hypothetical protein
MNAPWEPEEAKRSDRGQRETSKILIYVYVATVLFLSPLACDPGEIDLVSPENSAAESPALTVHALPIESDLSVVTALEWDDGISGAEVKVHKIGEPYEEEYWVSAETGSDGVAHFFDLLPGIYEVQVTRYLTAEEVSSVGSDAKVLAGGKWIRAPRDDLQVVRVAASRRRGLVFSEIAIVYPLPWETGGPTYTHGIYLELYNNSDETIFLDGMILGFAWSRYRDNRIGWTCSISLPFRTDPEGVWANRFLRFPGSGTEYPVAPGRTVLVARSAVDHTPIHSTLEDLSGADFEFPFSADNPDVPNLTNIGLDALYINTPTIGVPIFLSLPVDTESLPRQTEQWLGYTYARFPREAILDLVIPVHDYTKAVIQLAPPCSQPIDPHFEMLPGPALWESSDGPAWTAQRRVLITSDGRKSLQDTNTSMADFVRALKTPGWIPDTIPEGR